MGESIHYVAAAYGCVACSFIIGGLWAYARLRRLQQQLKRASESSC